MEIKNSHYLGWETLELASGETVVQLAPGIGGRIISLKHAGEELLFTQSEHAGELFDFSGINDLRARKKELGFRLWGGDKTWIAPQESWWEGIPPLEGDAGQYEVEIHDGEVTMKGPVCRETGIAIRRSVRMTREGHLHLTQTFRNGSDAPVRRGIWDVTQILRPFTVFVPSSKSQIRGYPAEGDSVALKESVVGEEGGWARIPCEVPLHFKFGGMLDRGELLALRKGDRGMLAHLRSFECDATAPYAHEAVFEVYNSPTYDYLEVEIHGPLKELAPGEEVSHSQIWRTGHVTADESPEEIVGRWTKEKG